MRLKDQGKNSILILTRTPIIAGGIIIALISLGLGYFIGFKTGTSGNIETEYISEKPPKPIINEDKRVLEPPPPPTASPVTPQTNLGKEDTKKPEKVEKEVEKKTEEPKIIVQEKQDISPKKGFQKGLIPEQKTEVEQDKPKTPPRVEEKKVERTATPKTKSYTIQLGAFPNRAGAEELKTHLKSKGINAYILNKDKDNIYYKVRVGNYSNKKEAERAMISLEKQTGIKGFVTTR